MPGCAVVFSFRLVAGCQALGSVTCAGSLARYLAAIMLRFALLLCLSAAPLRADALDRLLAGVWGSPEIAELGCGANAKRPRLLAPDLLRFDYQTGIWFPEGTWTEVLDYRILGRGEDWLLMQIPGEYRLFEGKPIVWRLEFTGPDRFVWHIHGGPDAAPSNPQIRCPGPHQIS